MKKPKVKIREIKSKVKIISEVKNSEEQESLETRVELAQEDPRIISTSTKESINPTLTQRFEEQEQQFIAGRKREEQEKEHFAYQMINKQTSKRNYNPSIRSGDLAPAQATAERIDPSLNRSASPISGFNQQSQPQNIREALQHTPNEPALKRFESDDREYEAEGSVQKYISKRKTDL